MQLAAYLKPEEIQPNSSWAALRQAQADALALENTAMVSAIDIGDAGDIHPKNKQEVARRLSLAALKNVYGRTDVIAEAPKVSDYKFDGSKATLTFNAPVTVDGDECKGFIAKTASGKWLMPQIDFVSDTQIVLTAPSDIVEVRYNWADFPNGNLRGLPKELAASELFGHVKGAFTGATENKTGMFAAANHGTLFLDEVGNLNAEVQRALLRALQEKRYRPVGGKEEIQTDIRLVAATNEDLEKAIAEGRFREDLFHRLNEFPLHVPLLAECIEDIIPLAEFMLDAANQEFSRKVKGFDREVQKRLKSYSWPGNIRELRMVVRRATLLAKDDWITTGEIDIPDKGRQPGEYSLNDERTERATILKALEATGNDRKAAARLLGISRSTLYLKLRKYRLD